MFNIVVIEILYPIEELGRLDCMGHICGLFSFLRQNKTDSWSRCHIANIEY